jgi:hypothetical protein
MARLKGRDVGTLAKHGTNSLNQAAAALNPGTFDHEKNVSQKLADDGTMTRGFERLSILFIMTAVHIVIFLQSFNMILQRSRHFFLKSEFS